MDSSSFSSSDFEALDDRDSAGSERDRAFRFRRRVALISFPSFNFNFSSLKNACVFSLMMPEVDRDRRRDDERNEGGSVYGRLVGILLEKGEVLTSFLFFSLFHEFIGVVVTLGEEGPYACSHSLR